MNCESCKFWSKSEDNPTLGFCSQVHNIDYWQREYGENAVEVFRGVEGKIAGDNIYTHKDFGCVNFERKTDV